MKVQFPCLNVLWQSHEKHPPKDFNKVKVEVPLHVRGDSFELLWRVLYNIVGVIQMKDVNDGRSY